ncbi:hypothetical protein [Brassicibacter mesophilus]|uniref:hypothetical protein n=1 Tax=Brassicibacter mesophilus TaxID=745119 RepID=UPI003D240D8C
MNCFGLTEVGASSINADSYYISRDNNVFAISDGASGAFDKVGAGVICMNTVKEFDYSYLNLKPLDYIIHCIKEANDRLVKKSQKDGCLSFGTMTMAVISNQGRNRKSYFFSTE